MNFNKKISIFISLILICSISFAANQVVYYDPYVVKLEGTVEFQTFPGLPGYESIKNGDEIERGPYLRLKHPIDVAVVQNDNENEPVKNVKVMQIVDGRDADWEKFRSGGHFRIVGKLFQQISGHHHSRVLIEVETVEKI